MRRPPSHVSAAVPSGYFLRRAILLTSECAIDILSLTNDHISITSPPFSGSSYTDVNDCAVAIVVRLEDRFTPCASRKSQSELMALLGGCTGDSCDV